MTKIYKHNHLYYYLIFSPDDNGYYAEIFNVDGKELHVTNVVSTQLKAKKDAINWINGE